MSSDINQITIIGAGVNGITTGIVLQLLGYQTEIISKDRADDPRNPNNPAFASLYPSASIIPHSVFGKDILLYFRNSQHVFELLLTEQVEGISVNQHFEVFEYQKRTPRYAPLMKNFRRIDDVWQSKRKVPVRSSTSELCGWVFDCLFTDWPIYLRQLFRWYEELGGSITIRELRRNDLESLPSPVINCSGLGGRTLFDDSDSNSVIKGHLVKIHNAPDIQNQFGQTISYNFNPKASVYSDAEGNAQDLYCYPREDGWIIGGSRLEGTVDSNGHWHGISSDATNTKIGGAPLPSPILHLNRDIIAHSFGIDLNQYTNRKLYIGYRYIRDKEKGLRLEKSHYNNRLVIHNYGHGGAGVTLSWGCAIQVAMHLQSEVETAEKPGFRNSFFNSLRQTILKIAES